MHILVTGASGHIGGRVVDQVRLAGHTVRILGRTRPADGTLGVGDEFVRRDLRFPESLTEADFLGCDGTLWMAVERGAASAMQTVNVDSVRRAAQLAEATTSNHCFVLFSSVSVFGTSRRRVVDETTETIDPFDLDPHSYWADESLRRYGQSKLQGEMALASAIRTSRAVALRPTVVLAEDLPPRRPDGVLRRFLWAERRTHFISASDVGRFVVGVLDHRADLPAGSVEIRNVVDAAGENMRYADAWGTPNQRGIPIAALRLIDWIRYSRRLPLRFPLAAQQFTAQTPHSDSRSSD